MLLERRYLGHGYIDTYGYSDFFMRERYIKLFFDQVDHFIASSRFLGARYVAWGIDPARMSVIENIIAPAAPSPAAPAQPGCQEQPLRIGFFGQISRLKGITVLLDCAAILCSSVTC